MSRKMYGHKTTKHNHKIQQSNEVLCHNFEHMYTNHQALTGHLKPLSQPTCLQNNGRIASERVESLLGACHHKTASWQNDPKHHQHYNYE